MSTNNECERCAEGDTSRIVETIDCLVCREKTPTNQIIKGVCTTCLKRYEICKILQKHYRCKCERTLDFCNVLNEIIKVTTKCQ